MMSLLAKDGRPKLVPECSYPLTGIGCVSRVYTDLAVFELADGVAHVRQTHGIDVGELAGLLEVELAGPLASGGGVPG